MLNVFCVLRIVQMYNQVDNHFVLLSVQVQERTTIINMADRLALLYSSFLPFHLKTFKVIQLHCFILEYSFLYFIVCIILVHVFGIEINIVIIDVLLEVNLYCYLKLINITLNFEKYYLIAY